MGHFLQVALFDFHYNYENQKCFYVIKKVIQRFIHVVVRKRNKVRPSLKYVPCILKYVGPISKYVGHIFAEVSALYNLLIYKPYHNRQK